MTGFFNFVVAHYWELMAACAVLFLLGAFLWRAGNALEAEGLRRMQEAQQEAAPTPHVEDGVSEDWYIYPPVG